MDGQIFFFLFKTKMYESVKAKLTCSWNSIPTSWVIPTIQPGMEKSRNKT